MNTYTFRKSPRNMEDDYRRTLELYGVDELEHPFYRMLRHEDGRLYGCYRVVKWIDLAKTLAGWAVLAIAYREDVSKDTVTVMIEYRVTGQKRSVIRHWIAPKN